MIQSQGAGAAYNSLYYRLCWTSSKLRANNNWPSSSAEKSKLLISTLALCLQSAFLTPRIYLKARGLDVCGPAMGPPHP